jgi:hypothetical protein
MIFRHCYLLSLAVSVFFGTLQGCGSAISNKQSEESHPRSAWQLQLKGRDGLQLTEDSSLRSQPEHLMQLRKQLAGIDKSRRFFRDPIAQLPRSSFFTGQLTLIGKKRSHVYLWTPEVVNPVFWTYASCPTQQGYFWCEYSALLRCLERVSAHESERSEMNVSALKSSRSTSANSASLLMDWFEKCGLGGSLTEKGHGGVRFQLGREQVIFEPAPLLSLLIYEGAWSNYEDAVVQAVAAATLPAKSSCKRADGACLESPLPIQHCTGCANLVKGRLYTVFFIESLRQAYDDVKSVVFTP